jgi:hypothetical protein
VFLPKTKFFSHTRLLYPVSIPTGPTWPQPLHRRRRRVGGARRRRRVRAPTLPPRSTFPCVLPPSPRAPLSRGSANSSFPTAPHFPCPARTPLRTRSAAGGRASSAPFSRSSLRTSMMAHLSDSRSRATWGDSSSRCSSGWTIYFVVHTSVFIDKLVVLLSGAPPPWLWKELTFLLLRSSSS